MRLGRRAVDLFRFSVPEGAWDTELEADSAEVVSVSRGDVDSELN